MDLKTANLQIEMPYEPTVSVNRIHYRGNMRCKFVPSAELWLSSLEATLLGNIGDRKPAIDNVTLDLAIVRRKRSGRKPDTSNFRKYIQDVVARCLNVDDSIFSGTDVAVRYGESDLIIISCIWRYYA